MKKATCLATLLLAIGILNADRTTTNLEQQIDELANTIESSENPGRELSKQMAIMKLKLHNRCLKFIGNLEKFNNSFNMMTLKCETVSDENGLFRRVKIIGIHEIISKLCLQDPPENRFDQELIPISKQMDEFTEIELIIEFLSDYRTNRTNRRHEALFDYNPFERNSSSNKDIKTPIAN